ncbi:MAG: phosphomannomutase/phosphoglucomutase [Bacteroidota bacterium]
MVFQFSDLQNGSDIRGVAMPGIPNEEVNLTPTVVARIANAFAHWLADKTNTSLEQISIAVGRDSRITGPGLMQATGAGIQHAGSHVFDTGMASTPAMFMSTITEGYNYTGAIMLTASHLPFNRNGMKFFTQTGGLDKSDIRDIIARAEESENIPIPEDLVFDKIDFLSDYANQLVETIRCEVKAEDYNLPLKGLKILVDAGNGAGGFFSSKVLEPLGAETTGSQFLEPDGHFPNHIPNPEDKAAMQSISKAVIDNQADLGIIFDTDVDRAALVDHSGNPINRNALIALLSAIVLEEHPGSTVVTDSITSEGLTKFIEKELKGKHLRFKRGYKNVINKGIELNQNGEDCFLAIETSGHGALKENYFLDDGAFLVAKTLIKLGKEWKKGNKNISSLITTLEMPQEDEEFRLKVNDQDFANYGEKIIEGLKHWAGKQSGWSVPPVNHEGIRVSCHNKGQDGWFLLRLSLHDPVLPLNIESNQKDGVRRIIQHLYQFLQSYEKLDMNPIVNYIENKA